MIRDVCGKGVATSGFANATGFLYSVHKSFCLHHQF